MAQNENPSPPRAGGLQPPSAGDGHTEGRLGSSGTSSLKGDLWGGVSAMLVALPSSIAYGVTIVAVLGPAHLAQGAVAGVIGAVALGITAACLGSARSLISAPCAPAAAILTALGVSLVAQAHPGQDEAAVATRVLLLTTLVALFSALIQIVFGVARGGRLIKYIPYPVVAGYLSGVGLMMILAQAPKVFGLHAGPEFWSGLLQPGHWNWQALAIGSATMLGMVFAPRLSKSVPAAIIGVAAGALAFAALALWNPELRVVAHNPLLVGPLQGSVSDLAALVGARWKLAGSLSADELLALLTPALTLATLLSIDTLKTCVVLDAMTGQRTNSNRELLAQGTGNLLSALLGGLPGAGTMGPTLVNLSSGGTTRRAGMVSGGLILAAFLFGRPLIAWLPIPALAGILLVLGSRMVDRESLQLLRHRATFFDFTVMAAVVVVALAYNLVAAAGVGIALAFALFMRDLIRGSVIRRKLHGDQLSSRKHRLTVEKALLVQHGRQTVVCELQGSLFFGTTDQLLTELDNDIRNCHFVILDLRRVQSFDFTAGHVLQVIGKQVKAHDGFLMLCDLPARLPTGLGLADYLRLLGILQDDAHLKLFENRDEALEWAEDQILAGTGAASLSVSALPDLHEIQLFAGLKSRDAFARLGEIIVERTVKAGEVIFRKGDTGCELFIIRRGNVSVNLPLEAGHRYHLTTFSDGHFFGDMAFLDQQPRSADAVAVTDTALFVLSRARYEDLAKACPELAVEILRRLCHEMALRLRYSNSELRALHES
ncbi:MAG: SulP family inorganic anion transporter [Limisphaerales bacterium]